MTDPWVDVLREFREETDISGGYLSMIDVEEYTDWKDWAYRLASALEEATNGAATLEQRVEMYEEALEEIASAEHYDGSLTGSTASSMKARARKALADDLLENSKEIR